MKTLFLIPLIALCGCTLFTPPVPPSKWVWKTTTTDTNGVSHTQEFSLENPKNFSITNTTVKITGNTPELQIGAASSVNDPDTINAGYQGQAAYIDSINRLLQTGIAAGAAKAATGGVK